MHKDCVFCQISANLSSKDNLISEGKFTFMIYDINPVSKGHALVISKDHYSDLSSSSNESLEEAIVLAKEYALSLKGKDPTIKGFNYISNQGTEANQVIFHFHLHIIPRY